MSEGAIGIHLIFVDFSVAAVRVLKIDALCIQFPFDFLYGFLEANATTLRTLIVVVSGGVSLFINRTAFMWLPCLTVFLRISAQKSCYASSCPAVH